MKQVSIDTHALLWYITNDKRLPQVDRDILKAASRVFVPTIVLLELLYLLQKRGRIQMFSLILNRLKKFRKYSVVALDLAILGEVPKYSLKLEMHDAIIVVTAKVLNLPLVTKDETIQKVYKNTIW